MFETIKKAGIDIAEAAFVLELSRAAIYNWKAGRSKPHKMLKPKLDRFELMLHSMLKQNKLPLPDIGDEERRQKIEKLKSAFVRFSER